MNKTNGLWNTKLYRTWKNMHNRVYNPKHRSYSSYQELGIKVCKAWHTFLSFYSWVQKWIKENGPIPKGWTLDRVNNYGDYKPSNCRFASRKTQTKNSRVAKLIQYKGETLTLKEFMLAHGKVSVKAIEKRIYTMGWPVKKAVLTPSVQGQH